MMLDEKMEGALPSEPMENGVSHRLIHPAPAGAVLSEEKAVEELARSMCPYSKDSICRECSDECFYKDYAKRAVCAGWHKQSEGEWLVNAWSEKSQKWIVIPYIKHQHIDPFCSLCKEHALLDGAEFGVASNFCPNCGAKMKGGE